MNKSKRIRCPHCGRTCKVVFDQGLAFYGRHFLSRPSDRTRRANKAWLCPKSITQIP